MPPATPGRYQSRLFNFFHQQSRRWGEQFERTIRHVQVAANWSLEALLTSVYMLIHKATESAGKQLHTNEQQPRFQLQESQTNSETVSSVDTPVQRVLEAAVTLEIAEAPKLGKAGKKNSLTVWIPYFSIFPTVSSPLIVSHPDSTAGAPSLGTPTPDTSVGKPSSSTGAATHYLPTVSSPPIVRGIASDLGSRNLVLVTIENKILDILTLQQQEILQNRILQEVARLRSWQLTQSKDETKVLSEIDRLLNKLTGSPQIIPALPQATGIEEEKEYQKLPNIFQKLPSLDVAIAQIESNAVVTISRTTGQLLRTVQNQLNIFVYGKDQPLTTERKTLDGDSQHQTSKVQALIWGAINYFFGERNTNKLEQKTPTNSINQFLSIGSKKKSKTVQLPQRPFASALPESPDLPSENIADPWLTMDDLFGDLHEVTEVVNEQQFLVTSSESPKSALPASPDVKISSPKSSLPASPDVKITRQINLKYLSVLSQAKQLIQNSKSALQASYANKVWKSSSSSHSPISQSETESNLIKDKKGEILYQQQQTTQVEAKPDWIEAQAQTIGYEKHPLEQVLEWLDQIMLWLEDIFVRIGLFLRRLFRGK
ncbi:hypothetical protein DP113_28680 [Brasilonema octagenarum UFV-E1]|uniref:Uncharacterized protein n=2 Tax=Bromeliae group (in: Brasilonema) TaxID=3398495 RepID=A0A856MQN0_9CYAN|nr:hypothetical protein DP114_28765 [Brasilonema sennae CENA114]QDL17697.1 hypothetical protein DP113_28680 [Brasilonema octagenarum UFV-E1]